MPPRSRAAASTGGAASTPPPVDDPAQDDVQDVQNDQDLQDNVQDEAQDTSDDLVVILDVVNWVEHVEGRDKPVPHRATAGQVLTGLPPATRERLLRHGAAAPRELASVELANREAGLAPVVRGELGDTELLGRAPADLVAYVTQHPTEAERVNRLERQRAEALAVQARADVLAATGLDVDGQPAEPPQVD